MTRFDYPYVIYTELLNRCPFSEEEISIMDMRRKGYSSVKIADKLCISEATLYRRISGIMRKICNELDNSMIVL